MPRVGIEGREGCSQWNLAKKEAQNLLVGLAATLPSSPDVRDKDRAWLRGRRREPKPASNRLVAAQIVEEDHIAWPESWDEELLDVSQEADPLDRSIEDAGRGDAIAAQGGEDGQGFPVPVRGARRKPPPAQSPAPDRSHVGFRPGLGDEDKALGVEPSLILLPPRPEAGDVRTLLLAWQNAFFEAQPLGVDEVPDRPVIDLDAALGQFGRKAAQGGVAAIRPAGKKPVAVRQQQSWSMAMHRAGDRAARRAKALRPLHNARHAKLQNRRDRPRPRGNACNSPLPQIQ